MPKLRMEKAVRALPDLFDDPFILSGSYDSYSGGVGRVVPPRQICDDAAETFNELVPDNIADRAAVARKDGASIPREIALPVPREDLGEFGHGSTDRP